MRISDNEVRKILEGNPTATPSVVEEISDLEAAEQALRREEDRELARSITKEVLAMPDRESMIEELRERIEKGEYNPSSADIVDGMIRRAIADRIR